MKVGIRSTLHISKILSGRSISIDLNGSMSLRELLKELTNTYGHEFYNAVCDEGGYPANKVAILINGVSAVAKDGVDTIINEGDDILIMPIISGG